MITAKRIIALICSLLLGLAVAAVAASPAAAASPDGCGSGYLCLYVNTGYQTNQGYEIFPAQSTGTCETVDPYRNALSSAGNQSGHDVRFYKNTGCTGTDYRTLNNGTGNPKFSTHWAPSWDNSVDAIRW